MENLIENITKEIVSAVDNTLSQKATREIIAKIKFRIAYQLEESLEKKGFIFKRNEDFLNFCENYLSMESYEVSDDGYNGGLDVDVFLGEMFIGMFITLFQETDFYVYYSK